MQAFSLVFTGVRMNLQCVHTSRDGVRAFKISLTKKMLANLGKHSLNYSSSSDFPIMVTRFVFFKSPIVLAPIPNIVIFNSSSI